MHKVIFLDTHIIQTHSESNSFIIENNNLNDYTAKCAEKNIFIIFLLSAETKHKMYADFISLFSEKL